MRDLVMIGDESMLLLLESFREVPRPYSSLVPGGAPVHVNHWKLAEQQGSGVSTMEFLSGILSGTKVLADDMLG